MRLKSYFAGSVEAAIERARKELGGETLLVHSRRSSVETRHLGTYEVVFAQVPARPSLLGDSPALGRGPGDSDPTAFADLSRGVIGQGSGADAAGATFQGKFQETSQEKSQGKFQEKLPDAPQEIARGGFADLSRALEAFAIIVLVGPANRIKSVCAERLLVESRDAARRLLKVQINATNACLSIAGQSKSRSVVALDNLPGEIERSGKLLKAVLQIDGVEAGGDVWRLRRCFAGLPRLKTVLVLPGAWPEEKLRAALELFSRFDLAAIVLSAADSVPRDLTRLIPAELPVYSFDYGSPRAHDTHAAEEAPVAEPGFEAEYAATSEDK